MYMITEENGHHKSRWYLREYRQFRNGTEKITRSENVDPRSDFRSVGHRKVIRLGWI